MKKTVFTGSGVALVTPIKNNKVDFDKLGELLDFHVENSTDAIKKGNKCDNLLKEGKRDEEGPEYYVELKGEDVGHALEQIKQTIHTIHNDHSPMMAFIICTNVSPSLSTKIQQFKSQLKKKYKGKNI